MEPIIQIVIAAAFAYLLLVGILYVGARIHFDSVSRWMQVAEQQLDTARRELEAARFQMTIERESQAKDEAYQMAWGEAGFDPNSEWRPT